MLDSSRSNSPFSVLARYPDFRLFWSGNLISSCGVWMQNLAQGWLLLKLSGSPLLLGLAGTASLLPTLLLSMVGGTIADRMDRRRILLGTQATLMVMALLLGTLTGLGVVTTVQIIAIIFLSGVATALNSPAYQAAIPDLVGREHLTEAIALNSIQFNTARIAGHSAAGLLVATVGEAGCFFLNGITYLAMLYALLRIRLPSGHIRADSASFWTRFSEGIQYTRRHSTLQYLIAVVGVMSLLGLPYFFLLPAFGRDVLGQDAAGLGYLMGSVSLGALIGGLLMTHITRRAGKESTALTAALLFWISLGGFALSRNYWLSLLLLATLGFVLVLTVATANNLLQLLTPASMRGRVMSIYGMALNGLAPVGSLAAGALAQAFSPPAAVAALAAVGLVFTLILVVKLHGEVETSLREEAAAT